MSKKSASKDPNPENFEAGLQELESLIERMEGGEQTLEQALKDFERGVELTRTCQQALQGAEQKVQILLQKQGKETLVPFEESASDENLET